LTLAPPLKISIKCNETLFNKINLGAAVKCWVGGQKWTKVDKSQKKILTLFERRIYL